MGSSGRSRCSTCGGAVELAVRPRPRWFPFCSERCQLVDLGKWIDEEYRIAGPEDQRVLPTANASED